LCGYRRLDLSLIEREIQPSDMPPFLKFKRYAQTIAAAANGGGVRLIAHVYVRYFGDLSGGLIMKELLIKSLGLNQETLAFYDFPDIADIATFKPVFRSAINRAETEIHDVAPVIDEAVTAFMLNIALSEAVYAATQDEV
jgi:heme oxygenase (biliverdin-producing, ferredoxin)